MKNSSEDLFSGWGCRITPLIFFGVPTLENATEINFPKSILKLRLQYWDFHFQTSKFRLQVNCWNIHCHISIKQFQIWIQNTFHNCSSKFPKSNKIRNTGCRLTVEISISRSPYSNFKFWIWNLQMHFQISKSFFEIQVAS